MEKKKILLGINHILDTKYIFFDPYTTGGKYKYSHFTGRENRLLQIKLFISSEYRVKDPFSIFIFSWKMDTYRYSCPNSNILLSCLQGIGLLFIATFNLHNIKWHPVLPKDHIINVMWILEHNNQTIWITKAHHHCIRHWKSFQG